MKNNHNMSEGLQPLKRTAALSTQKFNNIHSRIITTEKELCIIGLHNKLVHYYKKQL